MALTTQSAPKAATHRGTGKMAAVLAVSPSTVMRRAQANGLKLHRVRGINVSRNPKFVEKHEGSVGLDLYQPKHAIARCCAVQCSAAMRRTKCRRWPARSRDCR